VFMEPSVADVAFWVQDGKGTEGEAIVWPPSPTRYPSADC